MLDFGLVKLEGPRQHEQSGVSAGLNKLSGTPGFIAPEVVLGSVTDHRVDIHGCGLRRVLAGHLDLCGAFGADVLRLATLAKLARRSSGAANDLIVTFETQH